MGKTTANTVLVGKPKGKYHLEDLRVDSNSILGFNLMLEIRKGGSWI